MCRVLVLDDDVQQGEFIAESLQQERESRPYQVSVYSNADEALAEVKRAADNHTPVEILLIDQRLGYGRDGIEVLKEMRRISPEADAIVFTGFEDLDDGYRAYEAGAFRYLLKPFRSKELLFLLRSLRQYRQEQREHNWQKIYSKMVEDAVQQSTFYAVAEIVIGYAQELGFDRAHLFWSPRGEDRGEVGCLIGIVSAGEGCSPYFRGKMFYSHHWPCLAQALTSRDVSICYSEQGDQPNKVNPQDAWLGLEGVRSPKSEWAILPLWSGNVLLGAMIVDYGAREKNIPDHQRPWLNLFARQVAVVLERASLFEKEVRERDEATIISNIGKRITMRAALDDLETLLEQVRQQVKELMDVSNFIVVLADEETQQLDFCLQYESNQRIDRHWRLLGEGMAGYLLNQREVIYIPSGVEKYRQDRFIPLFGRQAQCWLGVPLRVSDKVVGGLIVQSYSQANKFKLRDVRLLQAVADQVAGAIQISRLAEAEKEDAARLQVLQRASVEMLRIADKDEDHFWLTVLTIATASFGCRFNRALLFLAENNNRFLRGRMGVGSDFRLEAHQDWDEDRKRGYSFEIFLQELASGAVKMTPYATSVRPVIIDLTKNDSKFHQAMRRGQRQRVFEDEIAYKLPAEFNRQFSFGSCSVLPLRSGSSTIGLVIVDNKHNNRPLGEKMLDLLEALLNNAGLVWESVRQHRQREALLQANYAIMGEANSQPLAETLKHICEAAHQVAEADWTIIYPIKPSGNMYEYDKDNISYVGDLKQPIDQVIKEKPRQKGVSAHILRTGRLTVADIDQDQPMISRDRLRTSHFIQREEVKALMGIPIRDPHTEEPLGVLYLDYRAPRQFSDLDIRQAESFANLAAIAILGARRFDRERQSVVQYQQREHEISRRMLEDALASKAEDDVVKALTSNIKAAFNAFGFETALVLCRWRSISIETEPEEVYQRFTVNSQNDLVIQSCPQNERASVAKAVLEKRTKHNLTHSQVFVPVKLSETVLGVLIARNQNGKVELDAVSMLEKFADVAALALDNVRRQEHLRAVLRAAQAVTAPTVLEVTFQKIVDSGRQVSPDLSALTLWYRDAETGNLHPGGSFGVRNLPTMRKHNLDASPEGNIVWYVMSLPEPIWASDLEQHPELIGRFSKDEAVVSVAAFPLKVDNEVVGAMFFNYRSYHYFNPEEQTIFPILAEIVGASIRDAARLEKERKEKERLDAAIATAETVGTVLDLDEVLVKVLEGLKDLFHETSVCVLLYDEDNHSLEFAHTTLAFYPIKNQEYQLTRTVSLAGPSIASRVARKAIESGQMEIENSEDVHVDSDYMEFIPASESELCVSLMSNEHLLGVLVLERSRKKGFNQDDISLVKGIARQISLSIDRARQSSQLSFKSTVAAATAWAADLAHDINRQVGQISSYAYLAREKADHPDKVREYTLRIEESANYLSKAGPWKNSAPEKLVLDVAIRKIVQDFRSTSGIEILFEPGCAELQVEVNPIAFQRVLRHLARNAAQAMGQAPQKKLAIRTCPVEGEMLEIQVEDYGPGLDDDVRASIFQRPVSTKGESGGFGLLLTRQMVEEMGGKIRLLPQREGVGATFSIRLPIAEIPGVLLSVAPSSEFTLH